MQLAQTHPLYKKVVAWGCIFGAVAFFAFQGITSGEGIAGANPSDSGLFWAILIGFSFNFLEAGIIAFIAAPMAGKVSDVLKTYGFQQSHESLQNLERIIDVFGILVLAIVYAFDGITTYRGAVDRGYNKGISTVVAIIQLPMFELMLNTGLWLREDAKIQARVLTQQLEEQGLQS